MFCSYLPQLYRCPAGVSQTGQGQRWRNMVTSSGVISGQDSPKGAILPRCRQLVLQPQALPLCCESVPIWVAHARVSPCGFWSWAAVCLPSCLAGCHTSVPNTLHMHMDVGSKGRALGMELMPLKVLMCASLGYTCVYSDCFSLHVRSCCLCGC